MFLTQTIVKTMLKLFKFSCWRQARPFNGGFIAAMFMHRTKEEKLVWELDSLNHEPSLATALCTNMEALARDLKPAMAFNSKKTW